MCSTPARGHTRLTHRGRLLCLPSSVRVPRLQVVPAADPNDFPRALAEVTTEWLSSVVGKEVTAFDSTPLEMGVLSDLGIVALTYNRLIDMTPAVRFLFLLHHARTKH